MSLTAAQVAALRDLDEQWPEAKRVIIGATALGFYYDMRWAPDGGCRSGVGDRAKGLSRCAA